MGAAAIPVMMGASLLLTGAGMVQQNQAQKKAAAAQNAATAKAEKKMREKTPEMQAQDITAARANALKSYRAGLLGNIRTSGAGIGTPAATINNSLLGGLKTKIGE